MNKSISTQEHADEPLDQVTAEEAAFILQNLRSETIRQWARRGHLRSFRVIGVGLLFSFTEIRALYNSRRDLFKPR